MAEKSIAFDPRVAGAIRTVASADMGDKTAQDVVKEAGGKDNLVALALGLHPPIAGLAKFSPHNRKKEKLFVPDKVRDLFH